MGQLLGALFESLLINTYEDVEKSKVEVERGGRRWDEVKGETNYFVHGLNISPLASVLTCMLGGYLAMPLFQNSLVFCMATLC